MRSVWTRQAEDDLLEIVRRLDAFSPGAGDRFSARLRGRLDTIQEWPRSGREVPEYATPLVREFVVQQHRVIYELFPDRIEIVAIRHGRERLASE